MSKINSLKYSPPPLVFLSLFSPINWTAIKTKLRCAMENAVVNLVQRSELNRQRRQLAKLDQHLLADIGVSREQALTEAARPATEGSKVQFKHNKFWL